MSHAKFEIVQNLPDRLVIRDLKGGMSVTNDAEWVVGQLIDESFPGSNNRRLFYYDTDGDLDELVIVLGKFYAFAPGPQRKAEPEPATSTIKVKQGGKCTRCGRGLKRTYVVDGVPYGPVCVRKVFGNSITITREDGKVSYGTADKPRRKSKPAPVEDRSQLSFFEGEGPQ